MAQLSSSLLFNENNLVKFVDILSEAASNNYLGIQFVGTSATVRMSLIYNCTPWIPHLRMMKIEETPEFTPLYRFRVNEENKMVSDYVGPIYGGKLHYFHLPTGNFPELIYDTRQWM